ncbi:MAG: J domain-containing protein [Ruminococcus sp.]
MNAEISISFNEAAFGCDKLINLSGADGSGKQTLKVHIPAGIDNGKSIRLRGKGNPGYGGAPAGDLLLKVHVGERPGFERKGTDVYTTVNVPFITAALGGEAKVQTLEWPGNVPYPGRHTVWQQDPSERKRYPGNGKSWSLR